ncbi:hypothetical protein B0T18DRAFT_404900 [Schizothecium vesticola]|uniref:Chromo domain-containing protein n=1 Tax=Schizothecium vesticola TaxID=314040 RepID=A0AA40F772_9PEZI|nr:hypothetical protein B0T18DRAFT_404900 [Schizothecium vesticola]
MEAVLRHRQGTKATEFLVKWEGWGYEHNVWKTSWELRHAQGLIGEYWARIGGKPESKVMEAKEKSGKPKGKTTEKTAPTKTAEAIGQRRSQLLKKK